MPAGTIGTWKELLKAFLSRFYPKSKSNGARRTITNFKNRPGEGLVRAYIRFRGLLDRCPHHDLPPWLVLHVFYGGLSDSNRMEVDLASGGSFMDFTITQAWNLLNKIRNNRETWSFNIGDEGGLKVEHDCIKAFAKTGQIDELAGNFHLDSNIILHIVQSFTEHIQAPKEGCIG